MKRVFYLDLLRIIGIIGVIMIHVATQNWEMLTPESSELLPLAFWEGINRFAVPLFVMISGAIFLDPKREISIKRLWKHNILRLVLVFFAFAAVYAAADLAFDKGWEAAISDLVFGHFHMWFIVLIIGLYMITPIARRVTADEKTTRYFLNLAVPVVFILNWFVPLVAERLTEATGLIEIQRLTVNYGYLGLSVLGGYLTYFILGYYLHKKVVRRKKLLYFFGVIGAVTQVAGTVILSRTSGEVSLAMRMDFIPSVLLLTMAVFVAGKQIGQRFQTKVEADNKKLDGQMSGKVLRALTGVASCVLGIYMVHILVLALVNRIGLSDMTFTPWLAVPVVTIAVFVMSLVLVGVPKWIIGKVLLAGSCFDKHK